MQIEKESEWLRKKKKKLTKQCKVLYFHYLIKEAHELFVEIMAEIIYFILLLLTIKIEMKIEKRYMKNYQEGLKWNLNSYQEKS